MEYNMFKPEIALCQGVDSYGNRMNTVVLLMGGVKKAYPLSPQSPVLFTGSLSECRNVFTAMSRFIETCSRLARRKDSSAVKSAVEIAAPSGESAASGKSGATRKRGSKHRIGFGTEGPA